VNNHIDSVGPDRRAAERNFLASRQNGSSRDRCPKDFLSSQPGGCRGRLRSTANPTSCVHRSSPTLQRPVSVQGDEAGGDTPPCCNLFTGKKKTPPRFQGPPRPRASGDDAARRRLRRTPRSWSSPSWFLKTTQKTPVVMRHQRAAGAAASPVVDGVVEISLPGHGQRSDKRSRISKLSPGARSAAVSGFRNRAPRSFSEPAILSLHRFVRTTRHGRYCWLRRRPTGQVQRSPRRKAIGFRAEALRHKELTVGRNIRTLFNFENPPATVRDFLSRRRSRS